jgi:hypothetical protein
VTDGEWQALYAVTSTKGLIWRKCEVAKRAVELLKTLSPGTEPPARRTAVLHVLDDTTFMRPRRGMIPARVVEDVAMEAMLRIHAAWAQREVKP